MKTCSVPGCSATLTRKNKIGVCREHMHFVDHCHCTWCQHGNAAGRAGPSKRFRRCPVADCSNKLGLNNKSGVCSFHRHDAQFCRCRACEVARNPTAKEAHRNITLPPMPPLKLLGEV